MADEASGTYCRRFLCQHRRVKDRRRSDAARSVGPSQEHTNEGLVRAISAWAASPTCSKTVKKLPSPGLDLM